MEKQFKVVYNNLCCSEKSEYEFNTHKEALDFCKSSDCMGIMDFTTNTAYAHMEDEDEDWFTCPLDMLPYDDYNSLDEFISEQEDTCIITEL